MKLSLLAHRGGEQFGKEHSPEVIYESLRRGYDLIELDVRKSRDGVLYCYHGNFLEFVMASLFLKKYSFDELVRRKKVHALGELVNIVGTRADIFLDVKEDEITRQDLLSIFRGKNYRNVYVARTSLSYLQGLGDLPKRWKKVQNAELAMRPDVQRLKEAGVAVFEGFFWSATRENITLLKRNGMNYALATWFLPKGIYCALSKKYTMEWIHAEKL